MNRKKLEQFIAETIKEARTNPTNATPGDSNIDSVVWAFADKFFTSEDDKNRFFNATVDGVVRRQRKEA